MTTIKAIETQYKGYRFRSRLEARWAVFFDALGVKWEYEKEGYEFGGGERYLPDFWLPDHSLWVEVKGQRPNENELLKLIYLSDATKHDAFVFMQIPDSVTDESWYTYSHDEVPGDYWRTVVPIEGKESLRASVTNDGDYHFLCPVCGGEYVHFNEPDVQHSDDYTAWQGRGDALRIPMWCENGHSWRLRFGFHKGFTFMAIEDLWAEVHNPGLFLAGNDMVRLERAFLEARSARFEHGETPANAKLRLSASEDSSWWNAERDAFLFQSMAAGATASTHARILKTSKAFVENRIIYLKRIGAWNADSIMRRLEEARRIPA